MLLPVKVSLMVTAILARGQPLAIRLVLVALLAVVSVQAQADSTGTATPPAGTSGPAAGATGADSNNAAKHAIDADTDTSSDSPVQKCEDLLPGFDDNPTNIKHRGAAGRPSPSRRPCA